MNTEILCVGTELLLGDIVNTNAAFLSRELAALGIHVYHQTVVGDHPGRLKEALCRALEQNDCVIMTGGLGPTYDDLTKETAAALFGRKMYLHEPSLERITAFFEKRGKTMTENNRKQAMMPEGAVIFENHNGTAPGLALEQEGKRMILLPGPPREMERMFHESVAPYLRQFSDHVLVSETVRIFNVGESAVEARLHEEMVSMTNPTVAPYAKDGEVVLRITGAGKDQAQARERIRPVLEQICAIYPDNAYGVNAASMQEVLVGALREKHLTVATAESCTGGLISKQITEIAGSSEVFHLGVCTYADEMKLRVLGVSEASLQEYTAVSEQVAREMAQGIRRLANADIGLSVTGYAGPTGEQVGLVYVGISSEKLSTVLELHLNRGFSGEREYIRHLAALNALYLALQAIKKY